MSGEPGMALPPVDERTGAVERHCADLFDVRVPASPWRSFMDDDERPVRPVGYFDGEWEPGGTSRMVVGPCNPTGVWGRNRHLFDAIQATEGDRYDEQDNLLPKQFRLILTCVRCGIVRELRGHLDGEDGDLDRGRVDPVPLQAGRLVAQQIRCSKSWGVEDAEWTVYAEGRRVGAIATARGRRGRRYVVGHLGRYGQPQEGDPRAEGPSALAVLRKLAKLSTSVQPLVRL